MDHDGMLLLLGASRFDNSLGEQSKVQCLRCSMPFLQLATICNLVGNGLCVDIALSVKAHVIV
jgi:hypothetical protein